MGKQNRITGVTNTAASGTQNFTYTHDSNGNILTENTISYGYDALNRLTSWTDSTTTNTYNYDDAGNLTIVEESGTPIKTFSYNAANQIANTGFGYDENGNMISDGNFNYQYDGENRLKKVTKVSDGSTVADYTYDYMGRRTSKMVSGVTTYFHYDGWNVVAETDSTGAILATYAYDNDSTSLTTGQPVSMTSGGQTYYYQFNAHGDVVSLTNSSGQVVNTYSYDPWGKILLENETVENPYRYAGYRYDSETELYYLQHRYYDPEICRFLTKDPVAGDLNSPQMLNLYVYCNDNPSYVDPKGLWAATRHKTYSKYAAKELGIKLWREIGDASYAIDYKKPAINPSYSYIHFNTSPPDEIDSRVAYADLCMKKAVELAKRDDPAYATYLGYGVHAMQDIYAHMNRMVAEHFGEGCWDNPKWLRWRKQGAADVTYAYFKEFLRLTRY